MSEAQLKSSINKIHQVLAPGLDESASFEFHFKNIEESIKQIIRASILVVELNDNESLDTLDASIKELLDAKQRLRLMQNAFNDLSAKVNRNLEFLDRSSMLDVFTQIFKELLQAYESKSDFEKYGDEGEYIEFRKTIWHEQNLDGKEFPQMRVFFEPNLQQNAEDEDIVISSSTIETRCPLTLQPIVHPIISTRCGHYYEKGAIQSLTGTSGCRCPVVGCNAQLRKSDLKEDPVLERRLRRLQELVREDS
ncbi:Smc5-6 complex non-SMC subunit 2 [Schizosaccharomyces cryophilus OY26]|uniref:Smc5-6 complex non-SMC subunit 2 n=1 Tax=Schizosaccharomyces cryophilus (strain OY26 / ATCC MYA-4695 / CBS 11777 / NBRC 106824 / NRRL Y48691) TaxID=653667 RepID=S9W6B1_SCHCR|nr:Smc5-6 complex non-SMC subunit 2 [Schizosaccharomyces cryophilus OY26]EPY53350.1 Smc5-6 complex non-SMC subunit 2 [Schizosaccharomyces cryophilus OY26]